MRGEMRDEEISSSGERGNEQEFLHRGRGVLCENLEGGRGSGLFMALWGIIRT
jgi:hypothetical protein